MSSPRAGSQGFGFNDANGYSTWSSQETPQATASGTINLSTEDANAPFNLASYPPLPPPPSPVSYPFEPSPMSESPGPPARSPHHDPRDPSVPYMVAHNSHPGYHRGRLRQAAEDNVPNRFELFLLGDGEKKVSEQPDTRIPSASTFTFNKEDHTLANMLKSRLLQSPHVEFSAYKVPHPMFSSFELRVQTDGTITPRAAVVQACRDLVNDLGTLSREFTKEWELRKMAGEGAGAMER